MSDERRTVTLAKWPFYLADLVLSGIIIFVLYQLGTFEGTTEMVIVAACLVVAAVAAWISILPWIREHDSSVHLHDSSNLKNSLEQIKSVEKVADLIRQSNSQWQGVQDASARTVAAAGEITQRMKTEADEFMKFLASANDQERAGLRLEVEKLRRMEGDWIKVAVQLMDHAYALFRAAERSGQRGLIGQLSQFQNACRDVTRRMGLVPFMPALGDNFDPRAHQLPNPKQTVPEGARISDILATGFTYQGQLLRRALVTFGTGTVEVPRPRREPAPLPNEAEGTSEPAAAEASEAPEEAPEEPSMDEPSEGTQPEAISDAPDQINEDPGVAAGMDVFETIEESHDSPVPETFEERERIEGTMEPSDAEPEALEKIDAADTTSIPPEPPLQSEDMEEKPAIQPPDPAQPESPEPSSAPRGRKKRTPQEELPF